MLADTSSNYTSGKKEDVLKDEVEKVDNEMVGTEGGVGMTQSEALVGVGAWVSSQGS